MTAREVVLEGGAPWGFRVHGGVDQNQPLRISRVNPGSKAALRGIREGDSISSINNQSTKNLTNIEAHGLLKNAGDILKLGLNEDPSGSPKRRHYRTIHQETLQETVKRSSVTTYSLSKTVESVDSFSDKDNEQSIEKNGQSSINGTSTNIPPSNLLVTKRPTSSSSSSPTLTKDDLKTISSDNALASQRSSYTNCTLSPSSPSIFSEDGTCSCSPGQDNEDKQNVRIDNMNDNQSSSRSKRRRQRRKNQNRKINELISDESTRNTNFDNAETSIKQTENVLEEYTVQSPVELSKDKDKKKPTKPVKSRSLDDDEMVKIQEVNEVSESEEKEKESQAIVSEASESEVEWEEISTLDTPPTLHGSLSTCTLPLEGCISEQITLMSPEEEKTLRDFLEGLNLVNGPEEAANQVHSKTSPDNIKQRKARKRAELEQYFLPIYQNPRYLDVISEESRESSDRDSDREQSKHNLTRVLRKGTPEYDSSPKTPPKIPPKVPQRNKKLRKFISPVDQSPAILVDTKIIDTPQTSEAVCSSFTTAEEATASNVEIVYLTSSETDSADELESNSSDSYVVASGMTSSNEDLSEKTLVNLKTDENVSNAQELTNTHKSDYESKKLFEEIVNNNETERTMTSTQYTFTAKNNKNFDDNVVNIDLLNQLTPPPTPDNTSPSDIKESNKIELISLINQVDESNLKSEPETHTNVLTPPPPSRSSSSSRSSSRGSSLCTARYNPSSSSFTDVIALTIDDEEEGKYFQALTLREICLHFLLSLPFGKEVLEELADVSKYIESYTRSLPSTVLPKLVPNLAPFSNRSQSNNISSCNLSVHLFPKKRQQDITYVKFLPKEKDEVLQDQEKFKSGEESKCYKNLNCIGHNNLIMERKVPVEVDSENKLSASFQREVMIPIEIQKEFKGTDNIETTKNGTKKEIVIPIIIEKETQQRAIPSEKSNKQREVKIPINMEKEIKSKVKQFVIPIKKESQEVQNYSNLITKDEKIVEKSISSSKVEIKPVKREFVVPITRENVTNDGRVEHKEKNIPIKREFVIPIKREDTEKEEHNLQVKRTLSHESKEKIQKEFIIPVTKEVSKNDNIEDLNNTNISLNKEFMIPIMKEDDKTIKKPSMQKERNIPIVPEKSSKITNSKLPISNKEINIPLVKEWTGMPTERDPKLLLCLSPKQKDQLEKSKQISDEAAKLIDLHEKFLNRKTSHEEITSNIETSCNRLLTIIKEEPKCSHDDKDYLYFVEKEQSSTLPRRMDSARLNAKDLTEWLNLARNKSMSESNLTTVLDIPENNLRNNFNMQPAPTRRTSLPHDIFEKQMIYIQEKEREIQRQLEALEEEKRRLNAEMAPSREFHPEDYYFSPKGDFAETKKRPISMPVMPTECFRQQMYEEYMDKFAEREERKQHKIIKVTSSKDVNQETEGAKKEIIHPIQIEDEFMHKVKELQKEGKLEKVKSLEGERKINNIKNEEEEEEKREPPVLVMDGEKLKEAKELPKHLQEFVGPDGIWSPGQKVDFSPLEVEQRGYESQQDESIPSIWTPKSANSSPIAERKEFKSVNFQSPVLSRRTRTSSENLGSQNQTQAPPWKNPGYNSDTGSASSLLERRLPISRSTPASGFFEFSTASRLPKAQNPTITLLQKAREGQLPKGASYIDQPKHFMPKNDRPPMAGPGEILYQIKNEYTSESDNERPRKMTDLGPRKFEGIGPVTKEGIPLVLRSEVKDQNQSKWYKRMYDTIHKQKPHNDEYVTIRYKQKRAQYPYVSGYLSEPEPGAYDSDFTDYKYHTLDKRRPLPQDRPSEFVNTTMPRPTVNRSSTSDIVRNTQDYYKTPGRIENYTPGHSSIAEKEAKQWWDEVMDIFDGHLEQQNNLHSQSKPKSFINQCLKESGYESDSTLVFRRREEASQQLSPKEQREAYKVIQKGGDVPLHGLRKLAPEKPKATEFVEFFPISPTLTKIRIHKNIKPQKEIICYPVTVQHDTQSTFSAYKRTAPSSAIPTPPPIPPPSPPRRKSSRNNQTLRLVSTMKVKADKSPLCRRHETCFTTTSSIDKTKVNYLKDKITCKLTPTMNKRSTSPKMRVIKKISASPELKNKITSTITTSKDPKTSTRKIQSKTNIFRSKSTDSVSKAVKISARKSPTNSSMESLNLLKSSPKTFGSEKKKVELNIKPPKLVKSPDLVSPTEVKKATMMHLPGGTIYKRASVPLSSSKTSGKQKEFLPIKVGISERGRTIFKTSSPTFSKPKRSSPSSTTSSTKVKSSLESLISPKLSKKKPVSKSVVKLKTKDTQKSKKEQINDEIKKDIKSNKTKSLSKKINSDASKKLEKTKDEFGSTSMILDEIRKQKDAIESNHFFQHLFLRDLSPTPSNASRTSWIVEKTNQLHRRRSSFPEPSISAMRVYLKHTKPVSDSKFISLDLANIRSRSASPKSVTFYDSTKSNTTETPKRSSSLPPKLIFSQTSRPISPVVHHKKLVSPPPSPKLCRSPSCRRIMQYKNFQLEKKPTEYSLYMCPGLNQSNTSLDSLKSEDYYKYFNEIVHSPKLCDKFKDLNHFYSEIEKVGELEKVFNVKPRRKSEAEIIDFDRWKEVRKRERAEQELEHLYHQIKKEEKDKGFIYMPKDVNRYRWKKEYDIGLRIKEKSVDDIKEEFEKIKLEESDRENARRRELAILKDTYKSLWRGFSVANIASSIGDRRSHSEGRVKTVRQRLIDSEKLLNHGIGSRIWSSLSMEQVNILKEQLAEIYNNYPKNKEDYSINVPSDKKKIYVPSLTVRRNSDSSENIYKAPFAIKRPDMSENDKKMISYTLSQELLDKLAKQRKENKLAIPLVVGKEVLGAVAAADANIKSETKIEEPKKALVKTNALTPKITSTSETESGSTDESTKTVICLEKGDDIKKKVEYFEHVKDQESYVPTIYKPAESTDDIGDIHFYSLPEPEERSQEKTIAQSKSCQSLKEYFGEKELIKFATVPLSATRKQKFSSKKPELRSIDISPIRSEVSINTSNESLYRSRSISPYLTERVPVKTGEVSRLRNKFEYLEDIYGSRTLKRSRSESDLNSIYPHFNFGYVDSLRRKYEYPAHAGRGRSRTRRGGVVSPMFLRAEDRFMPHINIISKIASLYTRKNTKNGNKGHQKSTEELAEILGCPVGEVEKLKEKFDSQEDISLMGHMYTSSPSIQELKDIAPYLTADWTAHKYPRFEDNTRSLSSPEHSAGSRDTSLVRKDRSRPKSTSPSPKSKKSPSILKPVQKSRSTDFFKNQKYDPKIHEPVARYQPNDVARYRNGWSVYSKPTVSFKEPEPPVPPPKGQYTRNLEQESPRKYVENEVTIHYKTPVRQEIKDYLSEGELSLRQAEAMKKIYQEERRKKYLQELQDMNSRRHTDNFIPSQKSPISLNRYDDFDDLAPKVRPRPRSPEHRLCARALYNFVGQSARELTFRKGDIIYLRRQIDKNWYEGELNAMVGLFPTNYVEIISFEGTKTKTTLRKAHEGHARAKYNFVAQTHLELSLAKGELVVVTKKIDENWFEGKIGGRKGIFPANYVEMLIDPQTSSQPSSKPVASPAAHSLLLNGSSGGKDSMGSHSYTPSLPNASQLTSSYHAKPVQVLSSGNYSSVNSKNPGISQALHIETQSEPIPYRAMYKYKPQNEDELELLEGDTVYVLEKCDDGWYVGSSERTGAFGTFPGNYVEKI